MISVSDELGRVNKFVRVSLLELMKLELQNKFCNNQRFGIDSYPTNLDLLAFRFALFMLTVYSFMYYIVICHIGFAPIIRFGYIKQEKLLVIIQGISETLTRGPLFTCFFFWFMFCLGKSTENIAFAQTKLNSG